jgi:hypothetical protein
VGTLTFHKDVLVPLLVIDELGRLRIAHSDDCAPAGIQTTKTGGQRRCTETRAQWRDQQASASMEYRTDNERRRKP